MRPLLPVLIVMVKEPRPGRVKTRLGRQIGMVPAAWWFRHQCRALLRQAVDPRWQVALAVSPDAEGRASRVWPAHIPRLPQGRGDLGARMGRLLQGAGPGAPVMIVGADIPGLRRRHIADAFRKLAAADAVIGPAPDGGYWLIGLRHVPPPGLFAGVRWSSADARADTLATMRGLRVAMAETLADVDEAADLPRKLLA
ncbi:TIGR04282 family arsenosugar biosynthesis glycosyltransferase [Frigidibacter sp.]|uniref:TIGR04282 family arsenosugar biosynthesis glycosyltransferase n=1 Tax=Frigidibacter sp. TaxID=2586418 RepID=UPI00352628CA